MADGYCYQLVEATPYLQEVIHHLLSQGNRDSLPGSLCRELEAWRKRETGAELREGVVCECENKVIKFSMVKEVREQLRKMPIGEKLQLKLQN